MKNLEELVIGVAGCTGTGPALAAALRRAGVGTVLYVDEDRGIAAALAQELGGEAVATLQELARREPDGVVIAEPSGYRAQPALALLPASAHLLIEYPLAPELADARVVAEDVWSRGRTVHHPFPQLTMLDEALGRIRAGALGELLALRFTWWQREPNAGLLDEALPQALAALGTLVPLEELEHVSMRSAGGHDMLAAAYGSTAHGSTLLAVDVASGRALAGAELVGLSVDGVQAGVGIPLRTPGTLPPERAHYRPTIVPFDGSDDEEQLGLVISPEEAYDAETALWLDVVRGGERRPAVDARQGLRIQALVAAAKTSAANAGHPMMPERI